ncbi:MAG: sugar ABC transporter permease [bacterium]|nr:sugar ABC transporter permease [bacterium]
MIPAIKEVKSLEYELIMTTRTKRKVKEAVSGYAFILPNIIGFLVFTSLPVLASFLLSFTQWDLLGAREWVGLKNFYNLLWFTIPPGSVQHWYDYLLFWKVFEPLDAQFWKFLGNTLFFMFGIPLSMAGSLALALALNQKIRGRVIFRTIYFLPTITAGIATYLLWRWLYNADFGLINAFISKFGQLIGMQLTGPEWLASTAWAKPALMLMFFWAGVGGVNMILYLAGLQNVPSHLYEAADIDGASSWQQFRHITWPMLTPTTFFIFTMSLIGGFQGGFDAAYVMTGGGPAGATTTLSYYIYNNAFVWFKMGYAASIAWVLFFLVFIATILNWKYGGKRVHYF